MQEVEIERIERACTDLYVAYVRYLDFRDDDAFLTLSTEDAVLDAGKHRHGLAPIREDLRAFRDPGQWGPIERRPDAERH